MVKEQELAQLLEGTGVQTTKQHKQANPQVSPSIFWFYIKKFPPVLLLIVFLLGIVEVMVLSNLVYLVLNKAKIRSVEEIQLLFAVGLLCGLAFLGLGAVGLILAKLKSENI